MLRYLKDHWSGKLPLWQTVWVNLFTILLVMHQLIEYLVPAARTLSKPLPMPPVVIGIALYALLVTWQVIGTVRAMEFHIRDGGGMASAWGIQAGLLAAFWVVLANIWGLWLTTRVVPELENFEERMEREHASKYSLAVSDDGLTAYLSGEVTLGVSRIFRQFLIDNTRLRSIVLESGGGNIYEARSLANLIREAGLTTRVETECSSACTLVFIGGLQRLMSPGARLGFHQYRVDADYMVAFVDPAGEQARDRALFAQVGVKSDFLDEMFGKSASEMWFPQADELYNAGVLTIPVR